LIAVLKRWAMATAAAMAALRTTALGNCGGGSSNEDGCRDSGGDDDGEGGNGVVMIALVALAVAHFVTRHVVANAIARVVAVAVAFFSVRRRGR
jgi:hypothetical protein